MLGLPSNAPRESGTGIGLTGETLNAEIAKLRQSQDNLVRELEILNQQPAGPSRGDQYSRNSAGLAFRIGAEWRGWSTTGWSPCGSVACPGRDSNPHVLSDSRF